MSALSTNHESRRRFAVPVGDGRVRSLPDLAQTDEVGVGIEHDDSQVRVEDQALEDGAEGVRLAGSGLAAEERVPVEPARVQRDAQLGLEQHRSDVEPRTGRAALDQVPFDDVRRRTCDRHVVERRRLRVQHHAASPNDRDPDIRRARARKRRRELGALDPGVPELVDLAQVAVSDGDVTADLDVEVVRRTLEDEPATVDGRGRGLDRRFEIGATRAHETPTCESSGRDGRFSASVPRR